MSGRGALASARTERGPEGEQRAVSVKWAHRQLAAVRLTRGALAHLLPWPLAQLQLEPARPLLLPPAAPCCRRPKAPWWRLPLPRRRPPLRPPCPARTSCCARRKLGPPRVHHAETKVEARPLVVLVSHGAAPIRRPAQAPARLDQVPCASVAWGTTGANGGTALRGEAAAAGRRRRGLAGGLSRAGFSPRKPQGFGC